MLCACNEDWQVGHIGLTVKQVAYSSGPINRRGSGRKVGRMGLHIASGAVKSYLGFGVIWNTKHILGAS